MKSVMQHNFAVNPSVNTPRSVFNRSHGHKSVGDAGWLLPLYWDAVLPGDTFRMNATIFARLATPIFPIMDNAYIDSHFFFVPNRLIWDNFPKFCGEQIDPGDSISYQIPVLSDPGATILSNSDIAFDTAQNRAKALMNYLGIPDAIGPSTNADISALPFRAYSRIYNEWFRDQNLIDSHDGGLRTGDAADDMNHAQQRHIVQRRGKRFDYFTQALTAPQKGTAVTLPLGTSAPLSYGIEAAENDNSGLLLAEDGVGTNVTNVDRVGAGAGANLTARAAGSGTVGMYYGDQGIQTDLTGGTADLSSATAATINDIREAFQVQRLLEKDFRGGTRYSELVKNHFGVNFYDVSYRPEYLGGGSTPIRASAVAATGGVETDRNVGDLGAYAIAAGDGHGFTKSFVEHGIVMGIFSIRTDLTYQQGINRHFTHSTRYDYFWPTLAHLGEQAILSKEIYADGTANDEDVFGYVPRYDEYRYKPSMITGNFQSAATATLDTWHLSQEFASRPTLGQTFIEETPPFDRVIAVPAEPHFIIDAYFDLKCARAIPTYGIPGKIDHF